MGRLQWKVNKDLDEDAHDTEFVWICWDEAAESLSGCPVCRPDSYRVKVCDDWLLLQRRRLAAGFLFICSPFNEAVNNSDYIASNLSMTISDGIQNMWENSGLSLI
jgi:hypothetical protein